MSNILPCADDCAKEYAHTKSDNSQKVVKPKVLIKDQEE